MNAGSHHPPAAGTPLLLLLLSLLLLLLLSLPLPAAGAGTLIAPPLQPLSDLTISLRLREAPVLDILRLLAEMADLNLVVHPDVQGTLTLELRHVPLHQALEMVLRIAGLGKEMRGNVLYVAPVSAILREAREERMLR